MSAKFYHIFLSPTEGKSAKSVSKKMDLALDWFKYDTNNWIVYSNASIEKLMVRYSALVKPNGNIFISELNIKNRNGWMSRDFWDWLNKKRVPKIKRLKLRPNK